MKKIWISLLLGVCSLAWASAQIVNDYKFASSTETYTELTDATALSQIPTDGNVAEFIYGADGAKVAVGEGSTIAGIDMGFDFKLGDETYRKFAVAGYGHIILGKADGEIPFNTTPLNLKKLTGSLSASVGVGTTAKIFGLTVSYKVEGSAGSKVLTVQFANIAYESADATDKMNYQIKLYEADNRIEMIFKGYAGLAKLPMVGGWSLYNLGLNTVGDHLHHRLPGNDWGTTEFTDSPNRDKTEIKAFPENLKYTFSLPDPCAVPTSTVTAIHFKPKSTKMDMVIDVDTTGKTADGVLVLFSKNPITESPDGKMFKKGDVALGGTVLAAGTFADEFDLRSQDRAHLTFSHGSNYDLLTPNESFYYTVFMMNSKGCIARYTPKVQQQGTTATTAPASLTITSATRSEVKLTAEANALGEAIAILKTTGRGTDATGVNRKYFGNFDEIADMPTTLNVGDKFVTTHSERGITFIDTAEVLYVGPAKADIVCPVNLENNRTYFFGALSKGKDNGVYSSLVANAAPYLTPAKLPFSDKFIENLSTAESESFIGGWKESKNFLNELTGGVQTNFENLAADATDAVRDAVLVIPALDFPKDSNVLVNIAYQGAPTGDARLEGDSICLEISTDAGQTFRTLKAVHKWSDNMELGKFVLRDFSANGVSQAVLRLRVVCANKTAWNIKNVSVNVYAIPYCPVPGAASVATTLGGTLALSWPAGDNAETQWNLSTAADTATGETLAWSRSTLVSQKPYYLAGLGDGEIYHVRVQAVCAGGLTSEWVASRVQGGRVPSFTENFNHVDVAAKIPTHWRDGVYYSTSTGYGANMKVTWEMSWEKGLAQYMDYKKTTVITDDGEEHNGAIVYDMDYYDRTLKKGGFTHFLSTPVMELNAVEKPQLTFEVAYGTATTGDLTAVAEADKKTDHKVALFICDSGNWVVDATEPNLGNSYSSTVKTDKAVQVWDADELMTWGEGKKITIDLTPYITEKRMASVIFGIFTTQNSRPTKRYLLYFDSLSVTNTIPLARSPKVKAMSSKIEDGTLTSEATIKWVADRNVAKWLVKVEGVEGETLTAPRYFEATGNEQRITGLNQEKTYKASVSHEYTTSGKTTPDTAAWVSVTFTTPGMTCAEPTALATSNITRKSVVLTWEGNAADGYRVRYRPVAKAGATPADFTNVEVKTNTYTLTGLSDKTEYECGVQAICNKTAEFESDFVAFDNFTTLELNCFAPTSLRVAEQKLQTAKVTWTGTSSAYQVAWALQSETTWTYGPVVTETNYTIEVLAYGQAYMFKVRGVCSPDSSEWSDAVKFSTGARPACPNPTNLRVEDLTQTSATLLWDTEDEVVSGDIQGYMLRHRLASEQTWDSIKDIKAKTYAITDMAPKTAYVWAVQTVCADKRYSENWAQLRFETKADSVVTPPDTTAVEDLTAKSGLYVTASRGQIHIMNPRAVQIDHIRIFTVEGRQLEQYAVKSSDHVMLTTAVRHSVAVVEVQSAKQLYRFKVLLQ